MNEIFNHLWQSTAFACAVMLACLALKRNSPRLRYWLWLAASIKFLIPFSLFVRTGARIQLPPDTPTLHAVTVQQISTYFAPVAAAPVHGGFQWTMALAAIWFAGTILLMLRWFRRWRTIHSAARRAKLLPLPIPVRTLSSPATMEPGVFGVFRPVLLLPEGIADNLTPEQFDAVIIHELRHLRCRDNLTAALHMCIETLFWFYPLVWWIGARLMEERERDCDESVLRQGSQPGDYARGIVQVCEAYIPSPLPCASGISGSDLKKRVREIMTWRGSLPMTLYGKAILAAAIFAAVSIPFAIGILRAQTLPPPPAYTYDVVSIHRSDPGATDSRVLPGPQGGLRTENTSVMLLLTIAYGVPDYRILGAPGWVSTNHYDITFTPNKPDTAPGPGTEPKDIEAYLGRNQQRLQAVLRDRLGLIVRVETRELPIFSLVQAKSGDKLRPHDFGKPIPQFQRHRRGQMTGTGVGVEWLVSQLSAELGRPVHDETGLTGQYDIQLEWTPDLTSPPSNPSEVSAAPANGPSIFTALTEQLGLRLQSTKGPVVVYVIEKIQPPGDN